MERFLEKTMLAGILEHKRSYVIGVCLLVLAALVAGGIFMNSVYAADSHNTLSTNAAGKSNLSASGPTDCKPQKSADPNSISVLGRITNINGATLTLQDFKQSNQTDTLKTTSQTQFGSKLAGKSIALGDLKVGDFVDASGVRNSDGSIATDQITVGTPPSPLDSTKVDNKKPANPNEISALGRITSINGATLTLQDFKQSSQSDTLKTTAQTQFGSKLAGKSIALSDLKVGDFVIASGIRNSDGSIAADQVTVGAPPSSTPKC